MKSKQVTIVAENPLSNDQSAGLSEIIYEMEKKLDSAQRRFNPAFGKKLTVTDVNSFNVEIPDDV